MQGTINMLHFSKGYGFIRCTEEDKDLFFHCTAMVDKEDFNGLRTGDAVEFELGENRRGKCATNVKRA
jgi:CspA family cold shock protein